MVSGELLILSNRINNAIELSKEGQRLLVEDMVIIVDDKARLSILGFSKTPNLGDVSKSSAISEIQLMQQKYFKWLKLTDGFQQFKNSEKPKFVLSHRSGQSYVGVCEMENEKINWLLS